MGASSLQDAFRMIGDLQRRVTALETGAVGSPGNPTQYGPNLISNGDMESGATGWARSFWTGTIGTISVETVNPLDGLRSLKVTEAASSSTRITWLPSGNSASPTIGTDVFPCAVGQVWLLSALMSATVATTHAKIYAICGNAPTDAYQLQPNGGNTIWVAAADIPLTANTPTVLQGTVTIPAGYNYVAFNCSPDDAAGASGSAWSWLLDDVSIQQRM